MKKILHILLYTALLLSCKQPVAPVPEPEFPTAGQYSIAAGESVDISFQANLDWEMRIPTSEAAFFYFDDAGIKSYQVKGKAGSAQVTVFAEKLNGTYQQRTLSLELIMGGKSAEIASVTLIPVSSDIQVFPARTGEDGSFIILSDGQYDYDTTPAQELHLTWPKGLNSYLLPIKVSANIDWSIIADFPSWMNVSSTSGSGAQTALSIVGNPAGYPLEEASGKISFMDTKTRMVVYTIPIRIDGCKDIVFTSLDGRDIELNIFGEYQMNGSWHASGCPVSLTATADSKLVAAGAQNWVIIEESPVSADQQNLVIQEKHFNIRAEQNYAVQREAAILAVPGYLVSDSGNYSDDFIAKYTVAMVKQSGLDPEAGWSRIAPINSSYAMAVYGASLERTDTGNPSDELYHLRYNNIYSAENAVIACTESFTSWSFEYSGNEYDSCFSLVFPQEENHHLFRVEIKDFKDEYSSMLSLKDASGNTVAQIQCTLSEAFWPEFEYNDIYFCNQDFVGDEGDPDGSILPQNVILEELSGSSIPSELAELGTHVWKLVYQSETSMRNAMIYVPPFPVDSRDAVEIVPAESWISVERGISNEDKTYIHVRMTAEDAQKGNSGYLIIRGGGRALFALVCERAFM